LHKFHGLLHAGYLWVKHTIRVGQDIFLLFFAPFPGFCCREK
jgi:hypothetical protein